MPVASKIQTFIKNSSFIREMFEAGNRLRAQVGADKVFDFSIGNPDLEPPAEFRQVMHELIDDPRPGMHGYMPNSGYPETRARVAGFAAQEYGKKFTADDIVMTCGAGGALNVIFKTILDPGDEVITLSPYFVEYDFYIDNHGGVVKNAATKSDFSLDFDQIAARIGPRTRALLINSPNNPTGVIYPAADIQRLSGLLGEASQKNGRPIFLVSDEPYRKIAYDGAKVPSVFADYEHAVVATSYSKDLSLPGERIGFIAVNPEMDKKTLFYDGLVLNNRILGFVNAPALMQRAVARLTGASVNVDAYKQRRDAFVKGLTEAGYELTVPAGAFYLFPRSPIADDIAFTREMQKENILVVPGTGFKGPGHFRLAYCVNKDVIERSIPGFARAIERLR